MRIALLLYANPLEIIPLLRHNEVTKQISLHVSIQVWSESTSISLQYMTICKNNLQVKLPCAFSLGPTSTFKPVINTIVPWRREHLLWNPVTLIIVSERLFVCNMKPQISCLHEIIILNSISWTVSSTLEKPGWMTKYYGQVFPPRS